jgi:hypothetical protein
MAHRDDSFKQVVAEFLTSMNLRVSDIPRSAEKTPDLVVGDGEPDASLIEIKQKTHDQSEIDGYIEKMEAAGFAVRTKPTGYRNRIDAIVGAGVEQLITKDPTHSYFHVLWFHNEGFDAYLNEVQLRATIYGTQKLISTSHPNVLTCYYFWNSSFFRYRSDLDAVITSRSEEAQMMLNDHSPRFNVVQRSKLASAFGDGVFFPQQFQIGDDTLICDHAESRDSEQFTLDYLCGKHGLEHLQTINMQMHEAAASLPRTGSE